MHKRTRNVKFKWWGAKAVYKNDHQTHIYNFNSRLYDDAINKQGKCLNLNAGAQKLKVTPTRKPILQLHQ
jgi:hypothetical protein